MRVWEVNPDAINEEAIEEAGKRLRDGGLIAFPTETVYGLGANALNDRAVRAIFEAKGRPADNPLIVHIADAAGLNDVVASDYQLPATVKRAMDAFWPGSRSFCRPPVSCLMQYIPGWTLSVSAVQATRLHKRSSALQVFRLQPRAPTALVVRARRAAKMFRKIWHLSLMD